MADVSADMWVYATVEAKAAESVVMLANRMVVLRVFYLDWKMVSRKVVMKVEMKVDMMADMKADLSV